MPTFPAPETGILLTHFIVSEDIARSRDFYADVLGHDEVGEQDAGLGSGERGHFKILSSFDLVVVENAALQCRSPGHGDGHALSVVRARGHVGDTHVGRP